MELLSVAVFVHVLPGQNTTDTENFTVVNGTLVATPK